MLQDKGYMDRVNRLKERVIDTVPEMDLENARILTEGFIETEGLPLAIRKAHAFRKQCREKTVTIWPEELIVGCSGSKTRAGILCADACWSVLNEELDTISTRRYDPFILKDSDRRIFEEIVRPYWKGRSNFEAWQAQIPDDVKELRDAGVVYINRKAVRGFGETTAGYERVISEGINGITDRIKELMKEVDASAPGGLDKINYFRALLISAEGIVTLAERYAAEAERQAEETKESKRREELRTIAEICRYVPANPARRNRCAEHPGPGHCGAFEG